jgi:putative acetyltransferase
VRLRPATDADGPAVRDLVFGVLEEYGLEPDPEGTDSDLRSLEGTYAGHGGLFDVLEDREGAVVGCVGLYPIDATVCELRKMYLRADVRGRGLGRRLLLHALDRARELGFGRVVLATASALKDAIALYERHGFRPRETADLPARCDGAYFLDL